MKKLKLLFILKIFVFLVIKAQENGFYIVGDFHQHTTFTDGSWSFDYVMQKNYDFKLDWWANSEHGGGFTMNGRESGKDLNQIVYWDQYVPNPIIGSYSTSGGHQRMWRWQSLKDTSFYCTLLNRLKFPDKTIIQGYEWNVPGHEHASLLILNNQFNQNPNCLPLAEFEYKFDNNDLDVVGGASMGWSKSNLTGHDKALEALQWLQTNYPKTSYVILAHPERKGAYNIAHIRNMNNIAPTVFIGFESMPGHQKGPDRGEYKPSYNSVKGYTFGGCGYFAAKIGGLWDALLSEGREFWLFSNSDFHDTIADFYPGEYQKTYTFVKSKNPQDIIDGLRSGNSWIVNGDLIDSLIFYVETLDSINQKGYMGSKLFFPKGKTIRLTIKVRDPEVNNNNVYSNYKNPELHHVDVIMGKVGKKIDPSDPQYNIDTVNTTKVIARFDKVGGIVDSKGLVSSKWTEKPGGWKEMTLIISNLRDSVYFRLRGTNHALNTPNETDGEGNPLSDGLLYPNNAAKAFADLWFYSNPIFVYTTNYKIEKIKINQPSDDLEEYIPPLTGQTQTKVIGNVDWTSSDLELGCEAKNNKDPQIVGVRFPDIPINKNREILESYIEFQVDATDKNTNPTKLWIFTEDNANPETFENKPFALSSRKKVNDSVEWIIPDNSFNVVGERYQSVDISKLVQYNINRNDWQKGNAMAFYIKGYGLREVESYDGDPEGSAALIIKYIMTEDDINEMRLKDSLYIIKKTLVDSVLNSISFLTEENYTIPSWTEFLIARKSFIDNPSKQNLIKLNEKIHNLKSYKYPYNIVININGDPSQRLSFNWFSNINGGKQKIQIVKGKTNDPTAFNNPWIIKDALVDTIKNLNYNASSNGLLQLAGIPTNNKKSYLRQRIMIDNLEPDTEYSFRVGSDSTWSEIGHFKTTSKSNKDFNFIYITDPQSNTLEMFEISAKTSHAAYYKYPNVNFWLHCGDMVETSGSNNSEWEWERFFETQKQIFMNNIFAPVIGNHDKSINKNFTYHFYTDSVSFDHSMSTTPGSFYYFTIGDVLFIAMSFEDYSKQGYLDSIASWIKKVVNSNKDKKWKIVFYHKAIYTGSYSHQDDNDARIVREKFAPLFDSLKIDIAFQGHDHLYEIIGPVKDYKLIQNAVTNQTMVPRHNRENLTGKLGGIFNVNDGTLYFLNNSAGKKKYEPKDSMAMENTYSLHGVNNYFSLFTGRFGQTGEPTFSYVEVKNDTFRISTYTVDDNGIASLLDKFMIIKPDIIDTTNNNPIDTIPTGIESNSLSRDFNVYPIPFDNKLYIESNNDVSHYYIYNIYGNLVNNGILNKGINEIELNNLSSGNYIIKIISNKEIYRKLLIKK